MNKRKSAKGQDCDVRVPGFCNFDPSTTVLAHFRLSGYCGAGLKPDDDMAAHACSRCHDAIDGRIKTPFTRNELRLMHAEGVMRTWMKRKRG